MVQESGFQISDKKFEKKEQIFIMLSLLNVKFFSLLLECSFDEMIELAGGNCLNAFTRLKLKVGNPITSSYVCSVFYLCSRSVIYDFL